MITTAPNITENVKTLAAGNRRHFAAKSNRASSIGHPCLRHLVYLRTAADKAIPISENLAGVFQTGTDLEPLIDRILSAAGQASDPQWRIVGGQTELADKILSKYEIGGTIDGILQVKSNGQWDNYGVWDTKTANPNIFAQIEDLESLKKYPWTAKYVHQLSIYGFGCNLPRCVIDFVNKANLYDHKIIEWDLDLGLVEDLLQKANTINHHIETGTLPDKINRADVCGRCEFAAHCMPDLVSTGNMMIMDDGELADILQRRAELELAKKEYDAIENILKKRLTQGQDLICGEFVIQWKEREHKAYSVEATKYWQKTITSLKPNGNNTES